MAPIKKLALSTWVTLVSGMALGEAIANESVNRMLSVANNMKRLPGGSPYMRPEVARENTTSGRVATTSNDIEIPNDDDVVADAAEVEAHGPAEGPKNMLRSNVELNVVHMLMIVVAAFLLGVYMPRAIEYASPRGAKGYGNPAASISRGVSKALSFM